ncbi:26S proteasome regulatory subunit [Elasticomyces elasticus]|nr:26S proteasome regulatory subunit [Elasticomyces elasticus]
MAAMDVDAIPNFLGDQRDTAPDDLQPAFLEFEDLWERKLWHELTDQLVAFFENPASAAQRLPLYETFISSFAEKINQLKRVTLSLGAASQCRDDNARLSFLTTLASKVDKPSSQDAFVYATTAVASVRLRLGDLEAARKDLDVCEKILDTFDSVETIVHASFYRTNADYYQAKHEFASYYRTALLYLACIDLNTLPVPDRQRIAYDLSIAALVSDSIYNFGELLLHPILDSLKDTSNAWLRDLLFAFNQGDLVAYDILSTHLLKNPLLQSHQMFLYQKISLAALTETVFRRPPHDRAMTFDAISQETKVQPHEIEHLIMKALSLGLLRGTIDQVAEVATIQWVQPKVLDRGQISGMRARLREWDEGVNRLGTWIEGVGKDVWAA